MFCLKTVATNDLQALGCYFLLSLPRNAPSSYFDLVFAFVNQQSGKRDARGGLMVMTYLGVEALNLSKPTESF